MRWIFLFLLSFTMFLNADVHEGDYFITGGTVETPDVVTGDVYALGSNVHIKGRVDGDVIAIGGTIVIDGTVQGSGRMVGGEVILNGKIGQSFSVVGGNLLMNPGAVINGNGIFTGGDLSPRGNDQWEGDYQWLYSGDQWKDWQKCGCPCRRLAIRAQCRN